MLGSIDSSKKKAHVIGGGISGLLISYELDKKGYEVFLYEAKPQLGGLIGTRKTPWGIAEQAAHSLLVSPKVEALFRELEIDLEDLNEESKARYILRDGKLRRFPLSLFEIVRTFFRALLIPAKRRNEGQELTIAEWARHHLGTAALRYLITPMLRGIYGATPHELTIQAAFPSWEIPAGKSIVGAWLQKRKRPKDQGSHSARQRPRMRAPRYGMSQCVEKLELRLRERLQDRLKTNFPVQELPQDGNVVLTVPSYCAQDLLKNVDPHLAAALGQVVYTPMVSITAFAPKSAFGRIPKGVGYLVPEVEENHCLGILFNSSSFSKRVEDPINQVSLTVMMGGSQNPAAIQTSDEELLSRVQEELVHRFGFDGRLLGSCIHRWERAIPQYNSSLSQVWEAARQGWCSKSGNVIFCNYTGQVSLRGMIETIYESDKITRAE